MSLDSTVAGAAMDPFESHTHSFIIKIWRERVSAQRERFEWRGHITHVPSGERRYLQNNVEEIVAFIVPYLEMMGVRFDKR